MNTAQKKHFRAMFDLGPVGEQDPLEVTLHSEQTGTRILEFTLNHPRNLTFLKKNSEEQKVRYNKIFASAIEGSTIIDSFVTRFESCKDGSIHLHGSLMFKEGNHCIEGIIMEFVGKCFKAMTRAKPRSSQYYPQYFRYKSPMLCCQYTCLPERGNQWENYINKDMA